MSSAVFPFLTRLADPGAPLAELSARGAHINDWPATVARADAHGLLPLLNRWITTQRPTFVPHAVVSDVKIGAQSQALNGLRIAGQVIALTRLLEKEEIPTLALKGPALAARAYGEPSLRPQGDLDLLVRACDLDRALQVLAGAGYERVMPLAPGQEAAFREVEYHHALTSPTGAPLELHWGIIKRQFGLRVAESVWWSVPQSVQLGGTQVNTLSNEALLVYLAIHGGKHEWRHLRWIGDIAAVSRLQPMNGGLVRSMSEKLGTLRMTRLALALAADVLRAELPNQAQLLARGDGTIHGLVDETRDRLQRDEVASFVVSTRFQLALRESTRDKFAFAWRHALTPNVDDIATAELGPEFRWLYHLLRPWRLTRKWLGLSRATSGTSQ